ncbi:hypothetical protein B0H13DRAFT_1851383 [Mycena leptocephala]|nr:hypothetical protein B0H13DRAFT_1851383 [Mycena leptocephala]
MTNNISLTPDPRRCIEESSESEVENSGFLREVHRRQEMRVGADVYSEYFTSARGKPENAGFPPWSASTAGGERGRGVLVRARQTRKCWFSPEEGIDVGRCHAFQNASHLNTPLLCQVTLFKCYGMDSDRKLSLVPVINLRRRLVRARGRA